MQDRPQADAVRTDGPGRLLQEARERKHLSTQAVADALHLRAEIIEALEQDRYDRLPPLTFSKGYLKAYAKLVEIPEFEVMAAFEVMHRTREGESEVERTEQQGQRQQDSGVTTTPLQVSPQTIMWGGLVVVGLLMVLLAFWSGSEEEPELRDTDTVAESVTEQPEPAQQPVAEPSPSEPEPEPEPAGSVAATAKTDPATPAAPVPLAPAADPEPVEQPAPEPEPLEASLSMEISGETWLQIQDGQGNSLFSGLVQGPRTIGYVAEPPYSLVIGNAAAIETLSFDGKPVHLRRTAPGRVIRLTLGEQR